MRRIKTILVNLFVFALATLVFLKVAIYSNSHLWILCITAMVANLAIIVNEIEEVIESVKGFKKRGS